jgi:hypothetical protein
MDVVSKQANAFKSRREGRRDVFFEFLSDAPTWAKNELLNDLAQKDFHILCM